MPPAITPNGRIAVRPSNDMLLFVEGLTVAPRAVEVGVAVGFEGLEGRVVMVGGVVTVG